MDFEELHGKNGSGTTVGVDLTTLMTSQVAVSTTAESGGDGGGSCGSDMTVPRIASFQVYWDVQSKQFKVFNPKVVDPDGNEITVTETPLSRGTYVCEVKKNATSGNYTATIKLSSAVVPGNDTVTVVNLFAIADGKVEQYHVGAIILGNGQITGQEGQTSGSKAVGVSGKIDAKGETGSGLVMKTYKTGEKKKLSVDLSGRKPTDSFGIHTLTKGDSSVKIFSTGDMEIPESGGSGGTTVLTGFEMRMDGNVLKINFKKTRIINVTTEPVADEEIDALTGENIDVVINTNYTSPNFQQTKMTIVALGSTGDTPSPENVFTTTPHSSES